MRQYFRINQTTVYGTEFGNSVIQGGSFIIGDDSPSFIVKTDQQTKEILPKYQKIMKRKLSTRIQMEETASFADETIVSN